MNESNLRVELEEVWVPKDAGELEGLLLTIQNEPGKRILKHKIQQAVKEKAESLDDSGHVDYPRDWDEVWDQVWGDEASSDPPWYDVSESW
jgi:hypothetical protein